jgi:hypothetical protein
VGAQRHDLEIVVQVLLSAAVERPAGYPINRNSEFLLKPMRHDR